jgi:hypothetical protein
MIRPIERFAINQFGGFSNKINSRAAVQTNQASPAYEWTNDWRFAFNNLARQTRHIIHFKSGAFKSQSFLVFANGKLIGVTAKNEDSQYRFDFYEPAKQIEISLRLPLSGCKKCAMALSDLSVEFLN